MVGDTTLLSGINAKALKEEAKEEERETLTREIDPAVLLAREIIDDLVMDID